MSFVHRAAAFAILAVAALLAPVAAAQDAAPQPIFREIESKYIFGFTSGADIGLEGEREVAFSTTANLGKRAGRYTSLQHRLEFETTVSQFLQLEFAALADSFAFRHAPGLANRNDTQFAGLVGEARWLILGRGPESPIGLTLSFEQTWGRLSSNSGDRERAFESEIKLIVDTELVPNRVFGAINLIYEPEVAQGSGMRNWERESTFGASAALAFRLTPTITVGAELGHYRHYANGLLFKTYEGQATYLGPTLHVQLTRRVFMQAAFSTQIGGHSIDTPAQALDLDHFSRRRARLKLAMEF